jgi:hypothetical protein
VENSIRYAWRDIRQRLDRRIDGAAVVAEVVAGARAGAAGLGPLPIAESDGRPDTLPA